MSLKPREMRSPKAWTVMVFFRKKVIGNYAYDPIKVCSTPLALEPKN